MCAVFKTGTSSLISRTIGIIPLVRWMLKWRTAIKEHPSQNIIAEAVILNLRHTKGKDGAAKETIIQLQVQPDKGRNFVAEMKIPPTNDMMEGKKIKVSYDPSNIKDIKLIHS